MTALNDLVLDLSSINASHRILQPRKPALGTWPEELHPALLSALQGMGAGRPYLHQAEATRLALAGRDVALTTGTASGKTLAFLVPCYDQMLKNPKATAILIYPTKALAWDQFQAASNLKSFLHKPGEHIRGAKYDGDTPTGAKKKIRTEGCNLLLTNPDELHAAVLQHHHLWKSFLENLRYVVLDEVHAYSGYFGSNVGLVIRRLRAVCEYYGSTPTFIAASATMENAGDHLKALIGSSAKVIKQDAAGSAQKDVFLVDPAKQQDPESYTCNLISEIVKRGLRGIVFANSRPLVERLADQARNDVGDVVKAYRAGYWHPERRQVEEALKSGDLSVVVSTNALELGIDIGDLDICVLHGLPPTNAEAWQRLGRVGRKATRPAVGVVVSLDSPVDRFSFANPDTFFGGRRRPESVVITPENTELLTRHLACAAHEAGGMAVNTTLFPKGAAALIPGAQATFKEGKPFKAYNAVNIRFIRKSRHLHVKGQKDPFGVIDGNVAHREAHHGAVYLHGGTHYRVKNWRKPTSKGTMAGKILCELEQDANLYTSPFIHVDIKIEEIFDAYVCGPANFQIGLLSGIFDVKEKTVAYYECWKLPHGEKRVAPKKIKYPKGIRLKSHGICMALAPETLRALPGEAMVTGQAMLHSLGHLLVAVLMDSRAFGRSDVYEYAFGYYPLTDSPTLFLYEAYPHGLGFTEAVFNDPDRYLRMAYDRVRRCRCENGCPACVVLRGRCAQFNEPHDKTLVTQFLKRLLGVGAKASRKAWTLPTTPEFPLLGETWQTGDDYKGCGEVLESDPDGVTIRRPSGQVKLLPWRTDSDELDS